jgi:hypothetical protein
MRYVKKGNKKSEDGQQLHLYDPATDSPLPEEYQEELTPEKVRTLLKDRGIEVSAEQASHILSFLRQLSNMIVSQYLQP